MSKTSETAADGRPTRTRDPERAKEAILKAALIEFGTHGFAGARTAAIAERAGLSTQLITHHFGGKQGVLDELRRRWKASASSATEAPRSFQDSLTTHMRGVLANTDWSRLVLWHALEQTPGTPERDDFSGRMGEIAEGIQERQRNGELDPDVDPRFAGLLGYLIAFAPLSLPDHLQGLTGFEPLSDEYQEWAASQLAHLLAAAPTSKDAAEP